MQFNFEPLEEDVIYPSDKTISEVNNKVRECLSVLKTDLPFPEITYDLEGRTAGQAIGTSKIRINLQHLKENRADFINNTIPHEVAHLTTQYKYPRASAHGWQWRNEMYRLGLVPTRCHDYETTPARVHKKYAHKCACETAHLVGNKVHQKILNGYVYYCRVCKQRLI